MPYTTTSTATQHVGPGEVEQNISSHFVGGGKDDRTKVGGPAITVPVHVPVNVYSPAHDPIFKRLEAGKSRIH